MTSNAKVTIHEYDLAVLAGRTEAERLMKLIGEARAETGHLTIERDALKARVEALETGARDLVDWLADPVSSPPGFTQTTLRETRKARNILRALLARAGGRS